MRTFILLLMWVATAVGALNEPKIDGNVRAVSAVDLTEIKAIAAKAFRYGHNWGPGIADGVGRIHIVNHNKAEAHAARAAKGEYFTDAYVIIERVRGRWKDTKARIVGQDDLR